MYTEHNLDISELTIVKAENWSGHFTRYRFPGEPGYETWPKDAYKVVGGVNNWAGMSLDIKRGYGVSGTRLTFL